MANTDVAHSIGGYYFQMLIACSEIVKFLNDIDAKDDDWVGVEIGSDIKIHKMIGGRTAIESKFYKNDKFTKEHSTVRHTIYNFYYDFKMRKEAGRQLCNYIYYTNVQASESKSSKSFFEDWNNKAYKNRLDYINYVKECLVHENIVKTKKYKEEFDKYKQRCKADSNCPKEDKFDYWYKFLIKFIKLDVSKWAIYAEIDDAYISEFIDLISFDFEVSKKYKMEIIKELYSNIDKELKEYDNCLSDGFTEIIRNFLMIKFNESAAARGEKIAFKDRITLADLKEILAKPNEMSIKLLNEVDNRRLQDSILNEIGNLQHNLIKYDSGIGEKLFSNYLKICENFVDEFNNSEFSFEEFLSHFTFDNSIDYIIIPNIGSTMAVFALFSEVNLDNLKLTSKKGITNFKISDDIEFSIIATNSNRVKDMEHMIYKFINNNKFECLNGNEIIVFDSPGIDKNKAPCKYDKNSIDDMILDYTQTDQNLKLQELYKSLNYRCTKCLDPCIDQAECIIQVENFIVNKCKEIKS